MLPDHFLISLVTRVGKRIGLCVAENVIGTLQMIIYPPTVLFLKMGYQKKPKKTIHNGTKAYFFSICWVKCYAV